MTAFLAFYFGFVSFLTTNPSTQSTQQASTVSTGIPDEVAYNDIPFNANDSLLFTASALVFIVQTW